MGIEIKDFNNPDENISKFNNANVDVVKVGDQRMMRITAQPGWKWSKDVKPHVGTESCQTNHLGYIAEGTICVRMDDGTEATYTKGQAYSITPGHDAWVVGDETAVAIEFHGAWGE